MTTYYKLDHSEPGYLSQMLPRADGTWVKRADYYADFAAAQAEIERLTKERDRFRDEAKAERLVQGALREKAEAERDEWKEEYQTANNGLNLYRSKNVELIAKLDKAQARNDQLIECAENYIKSLKAENERLIKERDEARAQVAAAYKVAAKYLQSAADDWRSTNNELPARKIEDEIPGVLELTPADAKSALEAYGRSKVQEGMQRAVDLYPQGIAAIRDDMEKLK